MFETRVLGHPVYEEYNKVIWMIKHFRQASGYGLKESKDAVEEMIGRRWEFNKDPTGMVMEPARGGYQYTERKPFVIRSNTRVRAHQVRLMFHNAGFTAEVVETNG